MDGTCVLLCIGVLSRPWSCRGRGSETSAFKPYRSSFDEVGFAISHEEFHLSCTALVAAVYEGAAGASLFLSLASV